MRNKLKRIPLSVKNRIRRWIKLPLFYFLSSSEKPISNYYGLDRGRPIDRFYIENFIQKNKDFITGDCLELLNNHYTSKYGHNITKSDILDIDNQNTQASIVDDLRNLKKINDNAYDCIILTQVFQFIDDLDSAISESHRILKENGALLVTLPSVSRIDCVSGEDGDFWRFTKAGAKYLFEKKFKKDLLTIESVGNSRSGIYFLAGLAQEDVKIKTLIKNDVNFPLIITVKAIKK